MASVVRRLVSSALVAALAIAILPGTTSAGSTPSIWGWVTARQPTTASYTPVAKDQGNSTSGTNTVQRLGVGQYKVVFGGLQAAPCFFDGCSGAAMVSALSTSQRVCRVVELGSGLPVSVFVDCFNRQGDRADSAFSVNFLAPRDEHGLVAYVNANDPTATFYHPEASYNYNSLLNHDVDNYIWHDYDYYQLAFDGEGHAGTRGNLQVSGVDANCKIQSRYDNDDPGDYYSGPMVICRNAAGTAVDAEYWATFTDGVGLKGVGGSAAYVFANKPGASSYVPVAAFRYSSSGQAPNVIRLGVGSYQVKLPGQLLGGSAQVTAFGNDGNLCQLSSILKKGTTQKVGVSCFKPNGAAADSKFYLEFTR